MCRFVYARYCVFFIAMLASSAVCHAAPGVEVTATEFGEKWPFTVDRGWLRCEPPSRVVFRANGTDYAVNGAAASQYAEVDPIWRADSKLLEKFKAAGIEAGFVPRISPTRIIKRGLALCD